MAHVYPSSNNYKHKKEERVASILNKVHGYITKEFDLQKLTAKNSQYSRDIKKAQSLEILFNALLNDKKKEPESLKSYVEEEEFIILQKSVSNMIPGLFDNALTNNDIGLKFEEFLAQIIQTIREKAYKDNNYSVKDFQKGQTLTTIDNLDNVCSDILIQNAKALRDKIYTQLKEKGESPKNFNLDDSKLVVARENLKDGKVDVTSQIPGIDWTIEGDVKEEWKKIIPLVKECSFTAKSYSQEDVSFGTTSNFRIFLTVIPDKTKYNIRTATSAYYAYDKLASKSKTTQDMEDHLRTMRMYYEVIGPGLVETTENFHLETNNRKKVSFLTEKANKANFLVLLDRRNGQSGGKIRVIPTSQIVYQLLNSQREEARLSMNTLMAMKTLI